MDDQSSCSIESSLKLPQVDVMNASKHCVTVVDLTNEKSVHERGDNVDRQHSSDGP